MVWNSRADRPSSSFDPCGLKKSSGRQHALPSAVMPSVHHMFWWTASVSSFQVFQKIAWCEDVSLSFNMTALQICPFAVLNVVLFRCLFNANRQTNNRTPFLGVLLIWQIGLGKIPKASPRENGDSYSLAFNTRFDYCGRMKYDLNLTEFGASKKRESGGRKKR